VNERGFSWSQFGHKIQADFSENKTPTGYKNPVGVSSSRSDLTALKNPGPKQSGSSSVDSNRRLPTPQPTLALSDNGR